MLRFSFLWLVWITLPLSQTSRQIPPMKISLDGQWLFKADPEKVGVNDKWYAEETDRSEWQTVQVPNFWKEYPGLAAYDGWGWYARRFVFETTPEPMSIHFSGVDDDAVVWLNGREVGSHTGWSDPFAVDLTHTLRNGENLVVVQGMDHGGGGESRMVCEGCRRYHNFA